MSFMPRSHGILAGGILAGLLAISGCAVTPASDASATNTPSPKVIPDATGTPLSPDPSAPLVTPDHVPNPPMDSTHPEDPEVVPPTPHEGESVARVVVAITSWVVGDRWVEATAMVAGVVGEEGTCSLVLTREGREVAVSGPSSRSASSSNCAAGLRIAVDELDSGRWDMKITFESPGYAGASDVRVLSVP